MITISILGLADYKITVPVVAVIVVSSLHPDIDEPNSLLVSRELPTSLLRLLQGVLITLAAF
ncbi:MULTISPECIES: hypothetical protein [Paenibacillus]|uniref:hypothetical protein n=1 Tax=Paenibacillus TaxID=44249 RepID=UPI00117E6CA1|nr:hypothetical protein [Paenibacillus odorifer]